MGRVLVAVGLTLLLALGVLLDPLDLRHDSAAPPLDSGESEDLGAHTANPPLLHGAGAQGKASSEIAGEALPPGVDLGSVDRDRDLHGVVTREVDGAPVAGAHLQAVSYPWQRSGIITRGHHRDERLGTETRSALDGTFRIRLKRGEVVGLRVDAAGFARVELRAVQAGERVIVALTRGITLNVRVADEDGAPIAGASVRMFGGDHHDIYRTETTAESGVAVFDRLVGDVAVTLDGKHAQYGDSGWTRYRLPREGTAEKALVLPPGRTIRGRITDADTGEAIVGARVGMGWTATNQVATDADGRYVLPGWTGAGVSTLTALAEGYGVKDARVDDLEVIDFELPPGATVMGRVVDADGRPVAEAQVVAVSVQDVKTGYATSKRAGFTDALGQFKLDSIRADLDLNFAAIADGRGRYSVRIEAARLSSAPLDLGDLALSGSRTVSGVVVDSNGDPAARLTVGIGHVEPGSNEYRPQYTFARTASQTTDDLGRFYFGELIPGRHRISVRAQGQSDVKQDVTVPEQENLAGIRIVVPATRLLRVSVQTTDGRPITELSVYVHGRDNYRTSASLSEDGSARLHIRAEAEQVGLGFPAGTFARYIGDTNQRITPGQDELRFVLQEALPTRGTLIGPDGEPMARLSLAVEIEGKRMAQRESNKAGQFEIPVPVGPRADLVITGWASRETSSGAIQSFHAPYGGRLSGVTAGAEGLVLHVRKLEGDRSLRVRVLLPSGAPAVGAGLGIEPLPAAGSGKHTDGEGRVELTGLSDEPLRIRAYYHGRELPENVGAVVEGVVPAGQEIVLHIREGTLLRGVVLDEEGSALENVEVRVAGLREGWWLTGRSRADGTWQVRIAPEDGEHLRVAAAFTTKDGKQVTGSLEGVRVDAPLVRLVLRPAGK